MIEMVYVDIQKRNVVIKFKPIFEALKIKLMDQIVRRELFIKQLLKNRDELYKEYEQNLKK